METNLFLFHQFGVWAVIDNILAKDRRSQDGINLLRIDILQLAIENKFITLSPQVHRSLLPQQYKRENIAILSQSH